MIKVYVGQEPPKAFRKSIFLAGPTPRSTHVNSWRPEALRLLEESGYDGVVFIPERTDGEWKNDYVGQIEWEETYLNMADCILFWIPRDMKDMPALTTNDEWGVWKNSGKVILGMPDEAVHVRYQQHYAKKYFALMLNTLKATIECAIKMIGPGAARKDGEREVPLIVWRTASFKQWYASQLHCGNRLDHARVHWMYRTGPEKSIVFLWALHVDVFIGSEKRHKVNEFVIARPDISTILMYRRRKPVADSEIVLIREFRSPVSNETGFVWELAGGSSFKGTVDPKNLAADECEEEAGITIDPSRIKQHEARQMVATLSAHKAHLFSVELTERELVQLKAQHGVAHGIVEDSEQTYTEILTLKQILERPVVDWSMLGMILSVLQ
jgi:8-oxo-dGTP pyrophosphatase MutT (NUDIX family)